MPRTRSQPESPGGFVSLDDNKRATRRSTRSKSAASRAASQEPVIEQPTEPVTQAPTRPKAQARTTKKTTTTTKKPKATASTATRRATRSSSRKASQDAVNQAQDSVSQNSHDIARTDNEETLEALTEKPESGPSTSDSALMEPKNSEREYNTSPTSLQTFAIPSPLLSHVNSPPSFSVSNPKEPQESRNHQQEQDSEEEQEFEDVLVDLDHVNQDILNVQSEPTPQNFESFQQLAESEVPPSLNADALDSDNILTLPGTDDDFIQWGYLNLDLDASLANLSLELPHDFLTEIDSALANHDTTDEPRENRVAVDTLEPAVAACHVTAHTILDTSKEPVDPAATLCVATTPNPEAAEVPTENHVAPSASEKSEAAPQTAVSPKETQKPDEKVAVCDGTVSLSTVDCGEKTAVEDPVDELTKSLAKISLSREGIPFVPLGTTAFSMEPRTLRQPAFADNCRLAFIYDDAPSSVPDMPTLMAFMRPPVQKPRLFDSPIPSSPSSVFDDGQAPPSVDMVKEKDQKSAEEEPRLFRHRSRAWHATPLSPIAEEQDLDRPASPAVLAKQAIPTQSVPVEHTTTSTTTSTVVTPVKPLESPSISSAPEIAIPTSSSARACVPLTSTGFSPSTNPVNGLPEGPNATAISSKVKNSSEDKTPAKKAIKKTSKMPKNPGNTMAPSKRAYTEDTPDDTAEPVTPYANKRRNLGPPGSTPLSRRSTRLTPLRRLPHTVSWTERKLRREAESQGRISKTIFRLPEYVAQTEADRRASEAAALTSTLTTEPLNANFDFSLEPAQTDDQTTPEEPAAAQEFPAQQPSTPEPARRSWNLSGLINSVPRSLTRLLPRFGHTRSTSEAPAIQEPASERIQRTQPAERLLDVATEQDSQAHRSLSEQPPAKRARTLSYSLFPAPIDRARYLGDIPSKSPSSVPAVVPAAASASDSTPRPAEKATPQSTDLQTSSTPIDRGRASTPQTSNATSESKRKRKRSPSPDVIPNPEGSSYGMDLKYFEFSDDSEDEAEPSPPPPEPRNRGQTSIRRIAQSERLASKKVRFDASPEDTPSKRRARATDPYRGKHFIGMGGPQTSSAPNTPTPESNVADSRQRPGFVPNTSGTFQLDYDAFSDESDTEDETVSSPSHSAPSVVKTPTSTQLDTSASSPAPRFAARPAQPPSTPTTKIDEEALARARSQAEKYKPKTPSGLRTTSRYSSPLTAITPDLTPAPTPAPALPAEKPTEKFGDDQFAKDAQWLYDICPTGDLSKLVWPEKKPFGEDLDINNEARRIANDVWDSTEIDVAMPIFQREFAEFKKTLV
ncbi:hypothetical protein BDW74DRAFT_175741 [Aspergillus multicolor]|uniref:uncharacterized protein n=1 Tax=Aspergillus multicolor TaxID=41759 RepID=UPI003CCDF647